MSGVAIITGLLLANAPLTAAVVPANIMPGVIPLGTVLPAVSIADISGMSRNTISMKEPNGSMATDRVQVTVKAKTYADQKRILDLVHEACQNTYGLVNGVQCRSIIDGVKGPDMQDVERSIFLQSRDFLVMYIS